MKFNNLFASSFVKTRLILILAGILLSIGCSGFIIYQTFGLISAEQDMNNFKEKVTNIIKVQNKEINLEEELKEAVSGNKQSNVLFSYDNDQSNSNPFRSLLVKKTVKGKVESQSEAKPVNKSTAKAEQENSTTEEPEIVKPEIRVLGILGTNKTKRAIVKLGSSDQEVDIVKVKDQIEEVKIKLITDKKVIVTKQGYDFSYELGGQNYEPKTE